MGKKKRKLFEQLRKNMYDRRASSVLEYGNESLYNEYINAQKSLDKAEDMYDRIANSYDRSEERKEELQDRVEDLNSKRDEMIGGIKIFGLRLPLISSFIHTKWLQMGITKKGKEFNKLERKIRISERTLARMNRKGTRTWDEILAAEKGIEYAEKRLSDVEKAIREFNKSIRNGTPIEDLDRFEVEEQQAQEEMREAEQAQEETREEQQAEQAQEEPEKNELDLRYESMMKSLDDINKEIAEAERNARYNKDGQQRLNELLLEKDKITAELNTVIQKQKERASKIELVSSQNKKRQKFKKDMKDPIANLYLKHHINRDNLVAVLGKEEANEFAYSLGVSYIKDILGYKGEGFDKSEVEFYIEKGLSLIDKINRGENIPKISDIIERLDNGEKIEDIPGEIRTKKTAKELYKLLSEHPEIANSENKVIKKEEELEVVS